MLIDTVDAIIKEFLKPGYTVQTYMDVVHDNFNIKFHNKKNNTYKIIRLDSYFMMNSNNKIDYIVDYLSTCTNALSVKPLYSRIFDHLMEEILWTEFTPGKLWD